MYRVEYYCPRQGQFWQQGKHPYGTYEEAIGVAQILKPPVGHVRVLDYAGQVVYYL